MTRALVLLAVLYALGACHEPPPPAYIRLSGPAPVVAGIAPEGATLVVFWAAWCPPCRTEAPGLRALARRPPEGLRVVTFSRDASLDAVEGFFEGPVPAELALRLDADGQATRALGGEPLPTSILIVEGRLVARFTGPRDWDSVGMKRLLTRLMGG